MARLHKRASAKRDLVEHFVYLAEQGGKEAAERFLVQFEKGCAELARHPQMGRALFENLLIFYEPRPGGVSIVRVLHGSRDWWSLLEIE